MRNVQQVMRAYSVGNHLTTPEMVMLRNMYHNLVVATSPLGEKYELVLIDAISHEMKLNGFLRARGAMEQPLIAEA